LGVGIDNADRGSGLIEIGLERGVGIGADHSDNHDPNDEWESQPNNPPHTAQIKVVFVMFIHFKNGTF
jgi:hypothetical protein